MVEVGGKAAALDASASGAAAADPTILSPKESRCCLCCLFAAIKTPCLASRLAQDTPLHSEALSGFVQGVFGEWRRSKTVTRRLRVVLISCGSRPAWLAS